MSAIGRASANVAAGTLVSRATGLVRSVVLASALGVSQAPAANAFGVANQLPNNIYAIISSGLLAGVIVPQIVRASRTHEDGGNAFVSKLLTLGVVVLGATTVLAVLAAPLLVSLFGGLMDPAAVALTMAFAYWCLPQIFFYGLYALLGEILNAKKVFGPFAWSPIINNVVSIIGFLAFIWLFGVRTQATGWTPEMIALMAGTATLGIVMQALVLLGFWRKAGLHLRPDFGWRGIGLGQVGRLAGWTFSMVIVGQIAGMVQTRFAGTASEAGASVAAMQFSWLVFMLPFSVIVLSIGTPYFTQLSTHAAQGDTDSVRKDLNTSTRIIGLLIVGALAAVFAAILPISRVFSHSPNEAREMSLVLAAYLVALVPLAVQFVIQRTFYAYQDTRTPFFFTLVQSVLVIATAWIALLTVPKAYLAFGIALGQSIANILQLVLAAWLLRRKLGTLGMRSAFVALGGFLLAAVPAAGAGWLTYFLLGGDEGWFMADKFAPLLAVVLIGGVSLLVYVAFLALFRTSELGVVTRLVKRLLPGR